MLLTARYVLPITAPHIEDGAIVVHDDVIVDVGGRDEVVARHPEEEVRDLGLAALMPGFVDLHTHLEYSALRGLVNDLPYTQWKLHVMRKEALLAPADWETSATLGALEALQSGITTLADITDSGASARAVAAAGLRGVVYREISTMSKAKVPDVISQATDDMAEWRELVDPSLVRIGIAPHAAYSCHPSLFHEAAALAAETGCPISTHLAGSRDEYEFVRFGSSSLAQDYTDGTSWRDAGWLPTGVSPVKYLQQWGFFEVPNVLAVHCVHVDDADIEVLASHSAAVAHCPRCNAKLGMGVAPISEFDKHGLRVGIGTDSPASNDTLDVFEEMRIGLLLQRAVVGEGHFFTAEHFVKMATIDAAEILGLGADVGSLEPGKKADVIAVDLSHSHQIPTVDPYAALVHTANQENVLLTMVEGRTLYDSGSWTTLDAPDALQRADAIRQKIRPQGE